MTSLPLEAQGIEIEEIEEPPIEPWWEYTQISSIAKEPVEEIVEDPIDLEFEAFVETTIVLETGWRKSEKWTSNFNPGGIRCYGNSRKDSDGYCIYETAEEGENALRVVLEGYYAKYGTDYKTIREIYCACGPEDYPKFMNLYYKIKESM